MEKKLTPWCENVKIAMIEREWSVQALADVVGMSRVYTSALINGRVQSEAAMKLISDTLNIESPEKRKSDSWCKSVRIAMVKRGWSVLDLAKAAHMSKGHTSAVINGRVQSSQAVRTISDVLNIEAAALSTDAT